MALSIARISDMILWCTARTERMPFTSVFKLSYRNTKLFQHTQVLLDNSSACCETKQIPLFGFYKLSVIHVTQQTMLAQKVC